MELRNLPGGVPEPEELIGRDHLIDVLWSQLAGNNILLVAPRRFGKTGVMRHVQKCPRPGYLPVYLDVEDISTPEAFAAELIGTLLEHNRLRSILSNAKRLPGKITDFMTGHIEEIGLEEFKIKLKDALGESWENIARRLVLEMEKADGTVIFLIDEFPQVVDSISRKQGDEAARSFLAWFRSLRMQQKDKLRGFRFIIGGSTGIDIILRLLNAPDKLNDFFRLPVGSVSDEDAKLIIQGLANKYNLRFTEEAVDSLLAHIGPPVPYFIHLIVSQIILDPNLRGRSLKPEDIDEIYHNTRQNLI